MLSFFLIVVVVGISWEQKKSIYATQLCSNPAAASAMASLGKTLLRGAVLRIASDLTAKR